MELYKLLIDKTNEFVWQSPYKIVKMENDIFEFQFPKCHVLLTLNEYCAIDCELYNPYLNNKRYNIMHAIDFNDIIVNLPKDIDYSSELPPSELKAKKSLRAILFILNKYLGFILDGDFSWAVKVEDYFKNKKLIQQRLNTPFIFEHSIYKKMKNNDPTWYDDLLELKS